MNPETYTKTVAKADLNCSASSGIWKQQEWVLILLSLVAEGTEALLKWDYFQ